MQAYGWTTAQHPLLRPREGCLLLSSTLYRVLNSYRSMYLRNTQTQTKSCSDKRRYIIDARLVAARALYGLKSGPGRSVSRQFKLSSARQGVGETQTTDDALHVARKRLLQMRLL